MLRALACMAVVMNHVVGWFYVNWVESTERVNYGVVRSLFDEVLIQPFVCFAIPCFLMVSGCLMLDPKRDVNLKKLTKYIIRFLFIVYLFSFAHSIMVNINYQNASSFAVFMVNIPEIFFQSFIQVFLQGTSHHLWYLVMLISLYILTPILRKFIEYSDKKTQHFVLLALFITTSVIPTCNDYFNLNIITFSQFEEEYIFLYLIGYYIVHTDFVNEKFIYWGGIIGFIIYPIGCYFGVSNQTDLFMILVSMMLIKLFKKVKIKNNKLINTISKYSLGIYVLHPFWLYLLNKFEIYFTIFPMIIGEFIFWVYAIVMSLITSLILYRLPLIKKLFK